MEAGYVLGFANGVCNHEAKLEEQIFVVAISSGAADECLPVVVEGLDASDWRTVDAESDDRIPVQDDRIMKSTQCSIAVRLGPTQDVPQSVGHRFSGGRPQSFAHLFFDLVGAGKGLVLREEIAQLALLRRGQPLPRLQHQPACAPSDGPLLVPVPPTAS